MQKVLNSRNPLRNKLTSKLPKRNKFKENEYVLFLTSFHSNQVVKILRDCFLRAEKTLCIFCSCCVAVIEKITAANCDCSKKTILPYYILHFFILNYCISCYCILYHCIFTFVDYIFVFSTTVFCTAVFSAAELLKVADVQAHLCETGKTGTFL